MDFTVALVLYIILLSMILVATWKMGINIFSATVVALLVSSVFLMILVPPTDLDKYANDMIDGCDYHKQDRVAVGIFCTIYLVTLVIVVWYILEKAYQDRVTCIDFPKDK